MRGKTTALWANSAKVWQMQCTLSRAGHDVVQHAHISHTVNAANHASAMYARARARLHSCMKWLSMPPVLAQLAAADHSKGTPALPSTTRYPS